LPSSRTRRGIGGAEAVLLPIALWSTELPLDLAALTGLACCGRNLAGLAKLKPEFPCSGL